MGVPQIIHLRWGYSPINHPFGGTTIYGNVHVDPLDLFKQGLARFLPEHPYSCACRAVQQLVFLKCSNPGALANTEPNSSSKDW